MSPGPRTRSWAPVRSGFLPHKPLEGCLRSAFLGTDPHTQPIWQIVLDMKPFPVFTGLQALNTPPDSLSLPFPHLRVGVLTLPRRTSMRVAWTRVDCGTSVLRKQGFLSSWPCLAALCSAPRGALGTRAGGHLTGRRGKAGTPGGAGQRCALVRTPGVAQPRAGLPSLSGTCVVTPETKAAVSSGRQNSHRVTRRCPQEGTLGCGGQLGAESWSPSETQGGGQLGAGGLEPVRDMG